MRSMTGFGRAEHAAPRWRIGVEIKSYNSRFLEVSLSVPAGFAELEPRLRGAVAERVARGRVELSLALQDLTDTPQVTVDTASARAYFAALQELAALVGGGPVTLGHLLAVGGFFGERRAHRVEEAWSECQLPLRQAFARLEAARARDGAVTAADLARLLARLDEEVGVIEREAPAAAQRMHAMMAARVRELLGESVDDGRLIAALAAVLAKADVNEELVRLRGHLEAFHHALGAGERAKKLEFISQELMREVNTIAAKGSAYAMSAAAVRAKTAIERMREHLRNVE